jgi:hypothetical protein
MVIGLQPQGSVARTTGQPDGVDRPNGWLAQPFTASRAESMTRPPTAVMGVTAPPTTTETTIEAPTPAAAERRPAAAPRR